MSSISNLTQILYTAVLCLCIQQGLSQCTNYNQKQSPKIANYDIKAKLDTEGKLAECQQKVTWTNTSPDTLFHLRFYMYMNAFKDLESSYLKGGDPNVFGQNLLERTEKEWGYIKLNKVVRSTGIDLSEQQSYIQPTDGNVNDQSILEISLVDPVSPGETIDLNMEFTVKLPRTIVRSGYGPNDFYLFVHWFPQVCVYEQDANGKWSWNSHQFKRGTEFFADFGDYDVEIDAPDHLVIGASGCRIDSNIENNRQVITFHASDLIDFGWAAYPTYEVTTSIYRGVEIEILMVPEHCRFTDRYRRAIEHSLDYLEEHVGKYAFPKITVIDPPVHTLNSGFMEYPMMITCATAYGIPRSVRSVESLVIHEFTHMYFMGTLASNEKEEAWLDEGFVTYYEDRILDHYYGEQSALFNVLGVQSGNGQQSRNEYVSMDNPNLGEIARPGWEFKGGFKSLIYAKTATALKTMERIIGRDHMDNIVNAYYQQHKFTHPKEADLMAVMNEYATKQNLDFDVNQYWNQVLHTSGSIDFIVDDITNNNDGASIKISKLGDLVMPVDIQITYNDQSQENITWDASASTYQIQRDNRNITSVHIDPDQKIYLDLNLNNNSLTIEPNHKPLYKYSVKVAHWFQTISHWTSFLM